MIPCMPRLTTHSTGAESACFSFVNLDAWFDVSRPVNSGVRHASHKTDSRGSGGETQKTDAKVSDAIKGRSNKRLHADASIACLSCSPA